MESTTAASPVWLVFLRTLCAVAEGAAEARHETSTSAACVLTVFSDLQCRITVMGGRNGMPRSLGSVYGGAVTRFLDGFRGRTSRVIAISRVRPYSHNIAISADGATLLVSDEAGGFIHTFSVHTGAVLQTIGSLGTGPLQFCHPCQVWVSSDGFVFVADCHNDRIQVLTPRYDFHTFVGVVHLTKPRGVCANDDVIVVTEQDRFRISVFSRNSSAIIRRFDSKYTGYSCFDTPMAVCFVSGQRQVAIVGDHVCVFTLDGEFVRHVGRYNLWSPVGVACSDAGELIVADWLNDRVVLFNESGEIVWTSAVARVLSVAIHGSSIFGANDNKCLVFT